MVLGQEEKGVYPLRNRDCVDRDHKIILLLIEEGGVKHYCLVKSLSRQLASQVSKHKKTQHFCLRCLNVVHERDYLEVTRTFAYEFCYSVQSLTCLSARSFIPLLARHQSRMLSKHLNALYNMSVHFAG